MPPSEKQRGLANKSQAIAEIRALFQEAGESFSEKDIAQIKIETPKKEAFPFLIFFLAISKDLIDTPTIAADLAGVTGIGLVFTSVGRIFATAFSLMVGMVLFFWLMGKVGWGATRLLKWAWKRWAVAFMTELLFPFIPAASIYVFMVHYRQSKLVNLFFESLKRIKKAGL